MNLRHARCAQLAAYAEDMLADPKVLTPPLDARALEWKIVGYLTAANALLGGQAFGIGDRVYFGFVAQSLNDAHCFVAVVRGTGQPVEWLENFEFVPISGPQRGLVECGFWSIYSSMRFSPITIEPSPADPHASFGISDSLGPLDSITVIGHSLGAALATYLLADLVGRYKVNARGALFASPRPGDGNYAHYVHETVGSDNYAAYAYLRDVVPHVPPSLPFGLGFQSLPNTIWITPAKAQAVVRNDPKCNHSALSYAAMIDYASISADPPLCILGSNP